VRDLGSLKNIWNLEHIGTYRVRIREPGGKEKAKNHKHGNYVTENSSHPVNRWFKEKEAYEYYSFKPKLCSSLEVDLYMVESARQLEHPPWIGDNMENVNTQMMAIPKRTATARIKAEMEQTIEEEGLEKHVRVYTDGSLIKNRVGCTTICEAREIKIRLPKQMSIFNAATPILTIRLYLIRAFSVF
jgi:hypothetical protein